MTPERQVFLTDGLVGIGPATVGVLTFGPEAGWLALPVALGVAALIAGVNYYDEHVATRGVGVARWLRRPDTDCCDWLLVRPPAFGRSIPN
jgi:hypothetical protein